MLSAFVLLGLLGTAHAACDPSCGAEEYCSPNTDECVPAKGLGEYCNSVQRCTSAGECEDNECVPSGSVFRTGCASEMAKDYTVNKWAGGTLYVTGAEDRSSWTHIVDLADAAIDAGCVPQHKPHMAVSSPTGAYAAISYTGDKFVHILDAATKEIVMCIDSRAPAAGVVGGAMHTVAWYGDDAILLCDMTGSVNGVAGGAIHKFVDLDFGEGTYNYESSVAIGSTRSARGTSGSKPISLGNNPLGEFQNLYYVTDAVGGGSIIDVETMTVRANMGTEDTEPCTGGGLWVEAHPEDPSIVLAQYGTQDGDTVTPECMFKVDMSALAITQTYELPSGADDTHGMQFCKNSNGDFFIINTNRASSTLDILDYVTGTAVVSGFDLNTNLPNFTEDLLQPDVSYYRDGTLFMAARGPNPVSAVKPQNFLSTATAGVFFLELDECVNPTYQEHYSLQTELDRSIIPSDVHGIWGVNDEIWVVDQAGVGSVQGYEVFSRCSAE